MSDEDLTDPINQADRVDPIPDEPKDVFIDIGGTDHDTANTTLPSERIFRDAWETPENGAVAINMAKAKDVWRDHIRDARADEFAKLDTQFMRALETGASTAQIATDKQSLRDAPQHADIDAATTVDDLKAFQPISGVTLPIIR